MPKLALHWQILIAIFLAVTLGVIMGQVAPVAEGGIGAQFYAVCDFVGSLFLRGLKMVVVPLVLASIIVGVYGLGTGEHVGRLGGKTLGFYMLSSFLAIMVGLVVVNITRPGIVDGEPAREQLNLSSPEQLDGALDKVSGKSAGDITDVFLRMIPTNVVDAAGDGNQLLAVIVFGVLFGLFMGKAAPAGRETLANFWQGVFDTMMHITLFIMKFAPIGVFGLVAKTTMMTGLQSFVPLAVFFYDSGDGAGDSCLRYSRTAVEGCWAESI